MPAKLGTYFLHPSFFKAEVFTQTHFLHTAATIWEISQMLNIRGIEKGCFQEHFSLFYDTLQISTKMAIQIFFNFTKCILKCLDNKWAVRPHSDSLKICYLTAEVDWLCTTQLGVTQNQLTQPLQSLLVTSYLFFKCFSAYWPSSVTSSLLKSEWILPQHQFCLLLAW